MRARARARAHEYVYIGLLKPTRGYHRLGKQTGGRCRVGAVGEEGGVRGAVRRVVILPAFSRPLVPVLSVPFWLPCSAGSQSASALI